ncbi:hypothetical protein GWI33_002690, partial [Rhynchophorus ferrugineus]
FRRQTNENREKNERAVGGVGGVEKNRAQRPLVSPVETEKSAAGKAACQDQFDSLVVRFLSVPYPVSRTGKLKRETADETTEVRYEVINSSDARELEEPWMEEGERDMGETG